MAETQTSFRVVLASEDAWEALVAINTAIESIEAGCDEPEIAKEIEQYATVGSKIAARFRAKGYKGPLIDAFLGKRK